MVSMHLYMEGKKCNHLAIHLRLSSLSNIMSTFILVNNATRKPYRWGGSNNYDFYHPFMNAMERKKYSNVCTVIVKYDHNWL